MSSGEPDLQEWESTNAIGVFARLVRAEFPYGAVTRESRRLTDRQLWMLLNLMRGLAETYHD